MVRTAIAAQTTIGAYPVLPVTPGSDLTEYTADVANGNSTPLVNAKTCVLVHNTGVGARTVTFTSVADSLNRTGDITAYSVAAGKLKLFGPFQTTGWAHSGSLWVDGSHAEVLLVVITLP